jgi:hypothetical protein
MMAKGASSQIDFGNVMKHVDYMRLHFPDRKSGGGGDLEAGRYIVEQMKSYGLDATLQAFETLDSDVGTSRLTRGGAEGPEIASLPCLHVEPTPASGVTAELVDVGPGGMADYEGKDVAGKFVLAEVSYAPATPEKARIAASKGASALILMNWGKDDSTEIPWRSLKSVWGNPTPENIHEMPRIAGISISRGSGMALRRELAAGSVRLHMRLTANRVWRTLHQPIGWLNAPEHAPERDRFMVVSTHIDGWTPGVTDNISGMSVMLELARSLAARRNSLARSVVFTSWNGHEVAEAAGSTYFVDTQWERINRGAVGYLNIDSVGMRGTTEFHVNCCPELRHLARSVSREIFGDGLPQKIQSLKRTGDQSFFGVGVPAITGRHSYSPQVVAEFNGATLGWYNHTKFDTIDVLDPDLLEADLTWTKQVLDIFLVNPALPYRLSERVADLRTRYANVLEDSGQRSDLGRIADGLDALAPEVEWLDRLLADANASQHVLARANGVALRITRQLTFIGETAVGKYGQDSYGSSTLLDPVPMLACLRQYKEAGPGSDTEKLLWTKLIRLRHQITDAIELARSTIADFRVNLADDGKAPPTTGK